MTIAKVNNAPPAMSARQPYGTRSIRSRLLLISVTATVLLTLALTGMVALLGNTREQRLNEYLQSSFQAICADVLRSQASVLLRELTELRHTQGSAHRFKAHEYSVNLDPSHGISSTVRVSTLSAEPIPSQRSDSPVSIDPEINTGSIRQLIQRKGFASGVVMGTPGISSSSGLAISAALPTETDGLIFGSVDIEPAVRRIEALFHGQVFIRDGDGRLVINPSGTSNPAIVSELSDDLGYRVVAHDGLFYELLGATLVDFTGRRIGSIHLIRKDDGGVATERLITYAVIGALLLCILLFGFGLHTMLRSELGPLSRIAVVARALSLQDLHVPSVDARHADEVGQISNAVERLRMAGIERDRLSFSMMTEHAQERALIEAEMRRFSEMLEPPERREVLSQLEQVRSTARPLADAATTPGDSSLAVAFRFMSERVRAQQERVSALLAQRTADLATVQQALAERSDLFRLREELAVARQLQLSLLPDSQSLAEVRNRVTLEAVTRPAKEVGGDSYDFQLLDGGRKLLFLICDSSGKGVPAAMFVLTSRSLASAASEAFGRLDTGLQVANAALARENDALSFTTLFIGLLDLDNGDLAYSNAGHNPPLLQRADGTIERLDSAIGLVLGAWEDSRYEQASVSLHPGDTLILYTDGITESHDNASQLFGLDRLEDALQGLRGCHPSQSIESLLSTVDDFAGDTPQFDDITLMVVRYHGSSPPGV